MSNRLHCTREHTLECLCGCIIRRIEDIGRVRHALNDVLGLDVFLHLSKHNTYWHSDHEKESEKLYELRMQISALQDMLANLDAILSGDQE